MSVDDDDDGPRRASSVMKQFVMKLALRQKFRKLFTPLLRVVPYYYYVDIKCYRLINYDLGHSSEECYLTALFLAKLMGIN